MKDKLQRNLTGNPFYGMEIESVIEHFEVSTDSNGNEIRTVTQFDVETTGAKYHLKFDELEMIRKYDPVTFDTTTKTNEINEYPVAKLKFGNSNLLTNLTFKRANKELSLIHI